MSRRPKSDRKPITIYVSPGGDDRWSGRRATANRSGSDGPLATIPAAVRAAAAAKEGGEPPAPVTIALRQGEYVLDEPLVIEPGHSGSRGRSDRKIELEPNRWLTITNYRDETAVIGGGRGVDGFEPTTLPTGVEAWVADLPEVRRGEWNFRELWVNGRRCRRPTLPREGRFRVVDPMFDPPKHASWVDRARAVKPRFKFADGDLARWRNLQDVEFVALHFWIESRIPFKRLDMKNRVAQLQWKSRLPLTDDHGDAGTEYYVENVFEALDRPGEFYIDRPEGKLYYVPRKGETIDSAEVIAPRLSHLIELRGDREAGRPVHHVKLQNLVLRHSHFQPKNAEELRATPQAACHVPGAIRLHHARNCEIVGCTVEQVGSYGIEIDDASRDVAVRHCTVRDLAAGGVKVWHTTIAEPRTSKKTKTWRDAADRFAERGCTRITVADNEITDGGHLFRQAVGVLVGKCGGNQVRHNHIHAFDYSGISVGWTWGYAASHAHGNVIEYNHVHDIGRGTLSDMGGIYTLGVQPGTRIRFNVFHDIESRGYGGWGIYLDEGSTDILVEKNLTYRTKSAGFHQHYGRDNVIQNNIFALAREAHMHRTRTELHRSFTMRRNIFYNATEQVHVGSDFERDSVAVDHNLYFNPDGGLKFAGGTLTDFRRTSGNDVNSLVLDPKFRDPEKADFSFKRGSPYQRIGFEPFDLSGVGPRPRGR